MEESLEFRAALLNQLDAAVVPGEGACATPVEHEQAYYRQTADLTEDQPAEPSLH